MFALISLLSLVLPGVACIAVTLACIVYVLRRPEPMMLQLQQDNAELRQRVAALEAAVPGAQLPPGGSSSWPAIQP